jgi:hypothetical protein
MLHLKNILLIFILIANHLVCAQDIELNTITTSVPFLGIVNNAQSIGSGVIGVVASDDYMQNGLDQNPAILGRGKKIIGFQALNYTSWLRELTKDIHLLESAYYQSFGKHAFGFSARLFSLGEINFYNSTTNETFVVKSKEYFFNFKYAFNFNKNFSMGCGAKYFISNLTNDLIISNVQTKAAKSIAVDLGFDYRREIKNNNNYKVHWNLGLAFVNIGSKVSYSDFSDKDFIPQEMKIGTLFTTQFKRVKDKNFSLDLSYQASKLLVPTPPIYAWNSNGSYILSGLDPNVNSFQGIIQSFYDAPGGAKEEWREILHQFGTEARFRSLDNKILAAFRSGYFHEHATKGNRKFITGGLGFGYKVFRFDIARIFPLDKNSPFRSTFSVNFSLRFDMENKE